jgi:ParB family chromosome partitioning protein
MSDLIIESKNKKKALGRGLGSLLGGGYDPEVETAKEKKIVEPSVKPIEISSSQAPAGASFAVSSEPQAMSAAQAKVWQLSIEKLQAGEYQPRQKFSQESLSELSQSIKKHGILQPLIVRKTKEGAFEIVAGERRWRAAQMAGLHEVPVLIKDYDHQKTLELSLIENIQREDLNPIDEAMAYERLIKEFGLSQSDVAERVGKERATVANAVRLLSLPQEIKNYVADGMLSQGHAKVLLSIGDFERIKNLGKKCISEKWSVRRLEKELAEKTMTIEAAPTTDRSVIKKLISGLSEELQKILGTRVSIDYMDGKGKVGIYFYSDEELTSLIERLKLEGKK